jgi:hypothetical protein
MRNRSKDDAAEFRQRAADCVEIAKRMSLAADRDAMMESAQSWLRLAEQAERETENDPSR